MPLAPDVPYEVGDYAFGGYVAGIIDTTQGNIQANDASQVGLRYLLIVAPASLESPSRQYKTANSAAPAAARTRWDGLSATQAMASDAATYPAADYCAGLSHPADKGSPWYLGAMDENELVYRNLKATTESNFVSTRTGHEFPGGDQPVGYNPSSDPAGAAYTSSVPSQTLVAAFRDGGGQDLGDAGSNIYYWSATEYNASYAWYQLFSGSAGNQSNNYKSGSYRVRPVRRVLVSDLLNTAPDAPTLTTPADGATLDPSISNTFQWQHSDPDGDPQDAYNFAYRQVGAVSWLETGWITSGVYSHTIFADIFVSETNYEWRVQTRDPSGAESIWSGTRTFYVGPVSKSASDITLLNSLDDALILKEFSSSDNTLISVGESISFATINISDDDISSINVVDDWSMPPMPISAADYGGVETIESFSFGTVSFGSNDNHSISLTENITTDRPMFASDDVSVGVSDSINTFVPISDDESGSVSTTEGYDFTASFAGQGDISTTSVQESAIVEIVITSNDTTSLLTTEESNGELEVPVEEDATISIYDVANIYLERIGSTSSTLFVNESADIEMSGRFDMDSYDYGGIYVDESIIIFVSEDMNDINELSVSDVSDILRIGHEYPSSAEIIDISAVDIASLDITHFLSSYDVGSISGVESISKEISGLVEYSVEDYSVIDASESSSVSITEVHIFAVDSGDISLSDQYSKEISGLIEMSTADVGSVYINDYISQFEIRKISDDQSSIYVTDSNINDIIDVPPYPVYAWNGTAWVPGGMYVWNGTEWVVAIIRAWKGNAWF